jgi:hypothetical protein
MPYTGKQSRIILSFVNSDGGDLFAHWLRDRLMKDLDYYSENAVFLDNVASRNDPGGKVEAYSATGATFNPKTDNHNFGRFVPVDWCAERQLAQHVDDGTVAGEGPDPDSDQRIFREQQLRGRNGEDPRKAE